jgi:hypothetical protein
METKTAKILSVQENQRQWDYQGTKYFDHWIKFEGSDNVWIYSSKSDKCEKFKAGEVATFDCDIKTNGAHTNYKIKPKQEQGAGGFKKADPKDQGIITYLSCLSSAANYFSNTKPSDWSDVMKAAEQAFNEAFKKSTLNK